LPSSASFFKKNFSYPPLEHFVRYGYPHIFAALPKHQYISCRKQPPGGTVMTKAELVKALKEKAKLATNAQAEAVHDTLIGILADALKKDNAVTLTGFGSFKIVHRAARKGRNPRTGKELQIPVSKAVKFTAGKALKDGI
jgi:DNA-binding protein HU-beta